MTRYLFHLAALALAATAISIAAVPISAQTTDTPAMLDLGGFDVFSIHCSAGSLTPQDRVDQITDRLTPLLGVPSIPPSSVRIYAPKGGNPSIYVLGRRIVTVDPNTAAVEGSTTPIHLATAWAHKLQQILPQVNYRKPGQPLPDPNLKSKVIVTSELADVGGSVGDVTIGRKLVMRLRGVQTDGLTAAERADAIRTRLYKAISTAGRTASAPTSAAPTQRADSEASQSASVPDTANSASTTPPAALQSPTPVACDPVQVVPVDPAKATSADAPVQLVVDGQSIIVIDKTLAESENQPDPAVLANSWAKNIRAVLAPAAPSAATAPNSPTKVTEAAPAGIKVPRQ